MNTAFATLLILVLLFAGCAAPSLVVAPEPQSELVLMTPLPPVTSMTTVFGIKLIAVFQVLPDGTIKDVTLVRSSGDVEWDRPAIDSMKQWRFVPITDDKEPTDRLIRLGVIVQIQDPVVLKLAEIVISEKQKADSLYALLKGGGSYEFLGESMASRGAGASWKPATAVNLARYPTRVRETLCTLRSDEVTEPIRIGVDYVIFKRYRAEP